MLMYREGLFDFEETNLNLSLANNETEGKLKFEKLIELLEAVVQSLFTEEGPVQDELVQQAVSQLPDSIQQLIFYRTWKIFGCLQGIHYDFGRHSYLHLPGELKPHYYANAENRVGIVCKLIEELNNF